jgi:hypothetical protein
MAIFCIKILQLALLIEAANGQREDLDFFLHFHPQGTFAQQSRRLQLVLLRLDELLQGAAFVLGLGRNAGIHRSSAG